ncbi:hypothetical protein IT409_02070 [Candidatus Falkowbacteria bacterium]|nr:hypothetical protein [Candidatus Falkowbacteria bacterium]
MSKEYDWNAYLSLQYFLEQSLEICKRHNLHVSEFREALMTVVSPGDPWLVKVFAQLHALAGVSCTLPDHQALDARVHEYGAKVSLLAGQSNECVKVAMSAYTPARALLLPPLWNRGELKSSVLNELILLARKRLRIFVSKTQLEPNVSSELLDVIEVLYSVSTYDTSFTRYASDRAWSELGSFFEPAPAKVTTPPRSRQRLREKVGEGARNVEAVDSTTPVSRSQSGSRVVRVIKTDDITEL